MFTHIVLFWQNPETPADARAQLLADCDTLLRKIPSVKQLFIGKPAMTPREVVDNSYDVGICCIYDDKAGHDLYQDHPLHKEFIARNKPHWKKVQIYDFV